MTRTQAKKGFFTSPPYTSVVTPTADGTQSKDKSPSPHFINLVEEWADSYIKSTELPAKILEEAKKEQLNNNVVRAVIEQALEKRGLNERRIRQLMPEQLKYSSKVRAKPKQFAAISAAKDYEGQLEESEDAPVMRVIDTSMMNTSHLEKEEEDLPPEMQAIAAKLQQAEESLDVVVVGRYGLFDAKRTTEVLVRDLGKLKSSGWKVIELTARHIS